MKRILLGLLSNILLLTACGRTPPLTPPTADSVIDTSIPSPTRTSLPSPTPTISITPLPTIPTFTPTFDVSSIVTVTPAPKVECPQLSNPKLVDFAIYPSGQKYVDHPTITAILDFLNLGGQIEQLASELRQIDALYSIKDITNDGIPDLIVVSGSVYQTVNILWCQNGRYKSFPNDIVEGETLGSDSVKFELHDLNQNGIPEVLSIGRGRAWLNVNMLEWNGNTFVDLTSSEEGFNTTMTGAGMDDLELVEPDENGISEMVLTGHPLWWYSPGEPSRNEIDIYRWNGKIFSPSTKFGIPQYRFQAIQDGDRETTNGNFEQAMTFYKMAIESSELDWWSRERFEHDRTEVVSGTPSPDPTSHTTEYPKLEAYAYYRIMLIHLAQNQETEATTTYNTLQQEFSNDPYGRPYTEMAFAFWDAFQSTHTMYDGCAAAIQYAVEHPEILTPLGSDYHGSQSHIYVPADVCPFR